MQPYHQKINQHKIEVLEVTHERRGEGSVVPLGSVLGVKSGKLLPYRACSVVVIKVDGAPGTYTGEAYCSIKDQYVRRRGYYIALGHAKKKAAKALGYIS
jgi:hypothetical protein